MIIKKIKLSNFRNYNKLETRFYKGINIIYGENAQGKTNLLESIYFLALTKSHRSFIDNNLIKDGNDYAIVEGIFNKGSLDISLKINIDFKSKHLQIDKNNIKKVNDYISNVNIIIFYPDDLDLLKGSPQNRRKYVDLQLSQLYSNYYLLLNEYNKLLRMRNEYLKKINAGLSIDKNYFDILTEYLINKAVMIYRMRYKYINKINEICPKIYYDIMDLEGFYINYVPNIDIINFDSAYLKEYLSKLYQQKYDYDVKLCYTSIGPHKDDIEFKLGGKNLKQFGSQGQQRVAVLALKLSEVEIFKKYKETTPILLLDDIFSELDDVKKNNLLKYISKDIQTIITTTELTNIDPKLIKKSKLFKIDKGQLIKIKEVKENERTTL